MSFTHALLGSISASGSGGASAPLYTGLSEVTIANNTTNAIHFNLTTGDFNDYKTFFFRCSLRGSASGTNYMSQTIDDRNQSYGYSGANTWWGTGNNGYTFTAQPGGNSNYIYYNQDTMTDTNDDTSGGMEGYFSWQDFWFSGRGDGDTNKNETIYGEIVNGSEPRNMMVLTSTQGYNTVQPSKISFYAKTPSGSFYFKQGTRIQAYGVTYGYDGE